MDIELSQLKPEQVYFTMIQTLVPRPIAWVLSENSDSGLNLAPFSYFNAICSNPPLVMLSIGKKPDGSDKDTLVNIRDRKDYVIHIPHREMLEPMNQSSATLPAGVSEVTQLGLETVPMTGSRIPRLRDCRIAYACQCYEIQAVGNLPQALVIGEVTSIYIDDTIISQDNKGRLKVNADLLDPLGRLGGGEYVSFGSILKAGRPA